MVLLGAEPRGAEQSVARHPEFTPTLQSQLRRASLYYQCGGHL